MASNQEEANMRIQAERKSLEDNERFYGNSQASAENSRLFNESQQKLREFNLKHPSR